MYSMNALYIAMFVIITVVCALSTLHGVYTAGLITRSSLFSAAGLGTYSSFAAFCVTGTLAVMFAALGSVVMQHAMLTRLPVILFAAALADRFFLLATQPHASRMPFMLFVLLSGCGVAASSSIAAH
jgi:hypothetical protein